MNAFFSDCPPILQAIVQASIFASLLAVLVLGLQWVARGVLPARFRFALWLLVFIRLSLIPLPASRISLFNVFQKIATVAAPQPAPLAEIAPAAPAAPGVHPLPVMKPSLPTAGTNIQAGPAPELPSASAAPVKVANAPPASPVSAAPATAARWIDPFFSVPALLVTVYFAGAAVLLLRLVLASFALRRMVRRAVPITDGQLLHALETARLAVNVRRRVELRRTDAMDSPAVTGIFRPCLLLPSHLAGTLSTRELHFVFLHECAHIRRGDVLLNCWWAILLSIHWFNPFLWLLAPRIRADRELACDELVLTHTSDPSAYGQALLKILELLGTLRPSPAAVGIIESRSSFIGRIQMIAKYRKHPTWLSAAGVMGVLTLACVGLTNSLTAAAAPAAPPRPAATPPPATAIQIAPQAGGPWQMQVTNPTQAQEKALQLRQQIDELNKQLGDLKTTSSSGAKDVAGIVTTLLQAQKELASQMLDMEKQMVLPAMQSATALDGGETVKGSQDPVIMALETTKFAVQQDLSAMQATGSPVDRDKQRALEARLGEIERQIDARKQELHTAGAAAPPPPAEKAAPVGKLMRNVRFLIGVPDSQAAPLTADQRAAADELVKTLEKFLGPSATVSVFNGTLIISATDEDLSKAVEMLDELTAHRQEDLDKTKKSTQAAPVSPPDLADSLQSGSL